MILATMIAAINENAEQDHRTTTIFALRWPVNQLARSLSGGNQQKIVVGREFTQNPGLT
jgi:ABC-type uncharacterized transport system ATPase subunit